MLNTTIYSYFKDKFKLAADLKNNLNSVAKWPKKWIVNFVNPYSSESLRELRAVDHTPQGVSVSVSVSVIF